MITITAVGFISEKPELQMVGSNSMKVEFDVVWSRACKGRDGWDTAWERATFAAWNEEAEKLASILEKGAEITCTGTQETSKWTDGNGQRHSRVKYRLTAWNKRPKPSAKPDAAQHERSYPQHRTSPARPAINAPTAQLNERAYPAADRFEDDMIPM